MSATRLPNVTSQMSTSGRRFTRVESFVTALGAMVLDEMQLSPRWARVAPSADSV